MKDYLKGACALVFGMVVAAIIGLLPAVIVMLTWNYVVPTVFGFTAITYWQAYCLYLLCSCLIRTTVKKEK